MAYGKFESIEEVAGKFDLEVIDKGIIDMLNIEIPNYPFSEITKRLNDSMSFINEVTICEDIIKPILTQISARYKSLYIWSHVTYNVDKDKGLVGEPDYLIARKTKHSGMGIPPLCVMEAKKEIGRKVGLKPWRKCMPLLFKEQKFVMVLLLQGTFGCLVN